MLKENNIYEVSYLESALGFVPGFCMLLVTSVLSPGCMENSISVCSALCLYTGLWSINTI